MLKLSVGWSILFGICSPIALGQQAADGAAVAADRDAVATAMRCDEDAARRFSQLINETADAVASAAFDSCHTLWASNKIDIPK